MHNYITNGISFGNNSTVSHKWQRVQLQSYKIQMGIMAASQLNIEQVKKNVKRKAQILMALEKQDAKKRMKTVKWSGIVIMLPLDELPSAVGTVLDPLPAFNKRRVL